MNFKSIQLRLKNKTKRFFRILKYKIYRISRYMNKCSNVRQESFKTSIFKTLALNGVALNLFCYSFTLNYYNWFGIYYFLHFDYTDVFNFTLGRLSVFFDLVLFSAFLPLMFLGFFITKNKCEEFFSNLQVWLLRFSGSLPIFIIMLFVWEYSKSPRNVLTTFLIFIVLFSAFYKQLKFKHDIFLIVLVVLTPTIGKKLGAVFAKERFDEQKFIALVEDNSKKNILTNSDLVIGQNKTAYIVINKKDTICQFIPKSKNIRISFKGQIK